MQTMAKQRNERLCARVDASPLAMEGDRNGGLQLLFGGKFCQQRPIDRKIEAGIPARNRMADPVALRSIEEQHLIGFRDGVVTSDMAHEDAAIGINQAGLVRAFFIAFVAALAAADDIANRDRFRPQQQGGREFRHQLYDLLPPSSIIGLSNATTIIAIASLVPGVDMDIAFGLTTGEADIFQLFVGKLQQRITIPPFGQLARAPPDQAEERRDQPWRERLH